MNHNLERENLPGLVNRRLPQAQVGSIYIHFACLTVRLYLINLKTAEPIGLKITKICVQKFLIFVKLKKNIIKSANLKKKFCCKEDAHR